MGRILRSATPQHLEQPCFEWRFCRIRLLARNKRRSCNTSRIHPRELCYRTWEHPRAWQGWRFSSKPKFASWMTWWAAEAPLGAPSIRIAGSIESSLSSFSLAHTPMFVCLDVRRCCHSSYAKRTTVMPKPKNWMPTIRVSQNMFVHSVREPDVERAPSSDLRSPCHPCQVPPPERPFPAWAFRQSVLRS